jgi:hypothetical protein
MTAVLTDDDLMGRKKADLNKLKEIKVKVPVRHLLNLHYLKITGAKGISDVVSEALTEYFERATNGTGHDGAE